MHLGAGARKKETGCEFGCNSVRFIAFSCMGETKRAVFTKFKINRIFIERIKRGCDQNVSLIFFITQIG